MTTEPTPEFLRLLRKLPQRVREATDRKLELFAGSPRHPSLRLKRVRGTETLWEISVNMQYRIVMEFVTEDHAVLLYVGTHQVFSRL
jgi:mRNA interferase RelE/StbE